MHCISKVLAAVTDCRLYAQESCSLDLERVVCCQHHHNSSTTRRPTGGKQQQ